MQDLRISTRLLSEAAWRRIFESTELQLKSNKNAFFDLMLSLEELRKSADYNTGSLSAASAWALYSVVYYFQVSLILEVGTFIGRSALAMALAIDDLDLETGEIHSCDSSNAIELPGVSKASIVQYPKKTSTEMFSDILSSSGSAKKFELLHLDGRLRDEDLQLLPDLCVPNLIVALDDFEGFEKGVANYVKIGRAGLMKSHLLLYPPSEHLLRDFGFSSHSTTALLVPQASIRLTAQ